MAVAERGPGLRAPLGDIRIVRIASVFSCVSGDVCVVVVLPLLEAGFCGENGVLGIIIGCVDLVSV